MELDLCGERSVYNPDADSLASVLRECASGHDFLAVLEDDDGGFVQTAGRLTDGFVLEYRDAFSGQFFRCMDEAMGLEAVTRAFASYLEGDDRWRTSFAWHPFDLRAESGRQRWNTVVLVAMVIGILGAIVLVLSR